MIFPSLYEEIDLNRYAGMAAELMPASGLVMVLCDDAGEVVWASHDIAGLDDLVRNYRNWECSTRKSGEHVYVECARDELVLTCVPLGDLAGQSAGDMLFFERHDKTGVDEAGPVPVPLICNISSIIRSELRYLYEVNTMARELGERYDELAMLRSSDLALMKYRESRHILSCYIRNCAEHLRADYAAIWIHGRAELYPGGIAYMNSDSAIISQLEELSVRACRLFNKGIDGFGINDGDEYLRHEIQLQASKKVVLVPVLDASGKSCGVVICLNEFASSNFTNSDKLTLEAVARKTFKYLSDTQDELTGILNRKGFEEAVRRVMDKGGKERHLVVINLDQFKVVNAAYGVAVGDELLKTVANRLVDFGNAGCMPARIESDEYALLIESGPEGIDGLVNDLCDDIDDITINVDGKYVSVKSRAGVVALNSSESSFADYLYAAGMALASAKEETNDRVIVYRPGNTALIKRKKQLTLVEDIRRALNEGRFELHCQRIESVSGQEMHYEILVRMIDENEQLVMPDEFISVAERYNLMDKIDRWIIRQALQLLSSDEFRETAIRYKWGINLSGMTISDVGIFEYVSKCIQDFNFPPTNLYFEITETAAIKNYQNCISFMNEIHSMGVNLALDDFGSGLSSFGYLKKLPVDYLKIDGSLIRDVVSSSLDQVMVSSISDIANVLGVEVIAEYVENDAILNKLKSMKIDYVQGFEIMRPRSLAVELRSINENGQFRQFASH